MSVSKEQSTKLASLRRRLSDERIEVRREEQEDRQRRIARREREEQRERDEERRKKEKWQEIARLQREKLNQPSTSAAAMLYQSLDRASASVPSIDETSRNLQQQINRTNREYAQAKKNREIQEQAYQSEQREAQARTEQQRRDRARQEQARLEQQRRDRVRQQQAQERDANLARQVALAKQQEQVKQVEKYQLVVEALAFCWEHESKKVHWRCRGPVHSRNSVNDATSLFEPDLLQQASYAGCSNASDNYKQAWKSGDKSGYVMHCQKALAESDADVAKDYGMPNYIRVKRKIYKCNYPIQNGCAVYMKGAGDVANRQVFQ